MTKNKIIRYKLQRLKLKLVVFLYLCLCSPAVSQVLQSPGSGIPGKVVASFARGNELAVLFYNNLDGKYIAARWNKDVWDFSEPIQKPNTGQVSEDRYFFTSIAVYKDTLYVGGYLDNVIASDKLLNHLQKWDGKNWVSFSTGIISNLYGITALDVFENKLICAGLFSNVIGSINVENIAAYDGNNWKLIGSDNSNQGTDGKINRLSVIGNDLYICGAFQHFAGKTTGNIAFYTENNSNWGGIGSPFSSESFQIASFNENTNKYLAALGTDGGKKIVRIFNGSNWNNALNLDTFTKAEINSIAGIDNYLLLGGIFENNNNATSLLKFDFSAGFTFTGNRIQDTFYLHQNGNAAFAWGNFKEKNSGIKNFAQIIPGFGHVYGTLFNDANQDCKLDVSEIPVSNVLIRFVRIDNSQVYYAQSRNNGEFSIALPEGNYAVQVNNSRHWMPSCGGFSNVWVKSGKYTLNNLAQFKFANITDVGLNLFPVGGNKAKPGDKAQFVLSVTNLGSSIINGSTIHVKHPISCSNYSSTPAPDNYDNGEATYTLVNFNPETTQNILIELNLPSTAAELEKFKIYTVTGSKLQADDVYNYDNKDTIYIQSDSKFTPAIVSKASEKGGQLLYTDRVLSYNVVVTNYCQSIAQRVVFRDTFQLADFSNVNLLKLPAGFSVSQSQGTGNVFVAVKDNAMVPTHEADPVNSVLIFKYDVVYDHNIPVNTNVQNVAYAKLGNQCEAHSEIVSITVVGTNNAQTFTGKIYPVPANEKLILESSVLMNGMVCILAMDGREIQTEKVENVPSVTLNISKLNAGVYVLKTPVGNTRFVVK